MENQEITERPRDSTTELEEKFAIETDEEKKVNPNTHKANMCKGVVLFILCLLSYAAYCLIIKIAMKKFVLNVPEL
jgi:hypothetical protein